MKKTIIAFTVAAAGALTSTTIQAQTANENIFNYRVGDYRVVLLSEGPADGTVRALLDAPAAAVAKYTTPEGTFPSPINAFAVVSPREVVLVDAGVGRNLGENLAAAAIGKIDVILLTHMHGDHIGGLVREGTRAFEGPALSLSLLEAEYWAAREGGAKRALDLYGFETVEPLELEDIPADRDGIFPIAAYGHTPGHTAFLVVSGGEKLLIWGDITHAMAVQMPHPEISVIYDVDPAAARETRARVLEYVAKNKIPVAGMHIPYPGIGTVERVGEGYKFKPVTE